MDRKEECTEIYECVSCSRPAFSGFCLKIEAGEFGEEEFLAFASCFRMVLSPECDSFNGHTRCLLSCRCEAELGYFLPHYKVQSSPKRFIARVERVGGRGRATLTEYVETRARYAQLEVLKQRDMSVAIDTSEKVYAHAYYYSEDHALNESDGYAVDESVWSGLAEDFVLEEILPRLPLESLKRFRRVSKKWWHYISNDLRFIFSTAETMISVIVTWEFPRHRILFVDHRGNKVEVLDVAVLVKRWVGKFSKCHVVGSCNGLLCLRLRFGLFQPEPVRMFQDKHEAVVLWNPETGEARDTEVPPLPDSFYSKTGRNLLTLPNGQSTFYERPVYGFAFDRPRNDYKVVRVWIEPVSSRMKFDVFSRNTGVWRELEKGLEGYKFFSESDNPVLIRNRFFWALVHVADERQCVLWFDVSTDEFGIVDHDTLTHLSNLPNQRNTHHRLVNLKKHDSIACLSLPNRASKEFLFQFFKCLANADEKLAALPCDEEPLPWKFCGVSWNRYFLEENKSNLVAYDCETGVPQQLFSTSNCDTIGQAHDYVPGLVSVYPDFATMRQCTRKMKAKYWVRVFFRTLGFTRDSFTDRICLAPEYRFQRGPEE